MSDPAASVLARHGRSFHFAARFLGAREAGLAARLYAACRAVDDIADTSPDPHDARRRLVTLKVSLETRRAGAPLADAFLSLHHECGLDLVAARTLVDGALGDLGPVRIADERALLDYAFKVAGCVGLMMCDVLGVRNAAARPFAADLGAAMQLTNIARDIGTDARLGRRYLPASWVDAEPDAIADPGPVLQGRLRDGVRRLLALAERYYESGETGLAFLPDRSRLAMLTAARVYRAIGPRIAALNCETWRVRAVVSGPRKCAVALKAGADYARRPSLHQAPGSRAAGLARWPGAALEGGVHG
ncbi:MAG: phytoene/squalene synthase family protein [Oceanicaulis sp.]